jgi:hypothetical protein
VLGLVEGKCQQKSKKTWRQDYSLIGDFCARGRIANGKLYMRIKKKRKSKRKSRNKYHKVVGFGYREGGKAHWA